MNFFIKNFEKQRKHGTKYSIFFGFVIYQGKPTNPNSDFERQISDFSALKCSAIHQDYLRFCLNKSKICSFKILRPEIDEMMSRFWCGGCRQAGAYGRRQAERCLNFAISGGFGFVGLPQSRDVRQIFLFLFKLAKMNPPIVVY